mmetsp:Transcript_33697/g.75324  ORF Transcript_33697/g.75324 Transcript_33697/m.75324 type:complete len:200 (+) Transcript_33697:73-672(+)
MASTISFKFKSAKDFDTVSFQGLGLRLFDLKRLIVEKRQMNKGLDFDLHVTNSASGEVYRDETKLISKNTAVVVKRVPANKNGLLERIKNQAAGGLSVASQKLYSHCFPAVSTKIAVFHETNLGCYYHSVLHRVLCLFALVGRMKFLVDQVSRQKPLIYSLFAPFHAPPHVNSQLSIINSVSHHVVVRHYESECSSCVG